MNLLESQSLENLKQVTAVTAFTSDMWKRTDFFVLEGHLQKAPQSQLPPVESCQRTTVLWDTVPLSQWGCCLSCCQLNRFPGQRTLFFANRAVLCGLDSSSQGYVQTGCWHVALGLWELSPQGEAQLNPWPQLPVGPSNVDTDVQAT